MKKLIQLAIQQCSEFNATSNRWAVLSKQEFVILVIGPKWIGVRERAFLIRRYDLDDKGEPKYFDSWLL